LPMNKFWTLRPQVSYRYNQDDYIFIRKKPEVYRNIHETNVVNAELNNTFYSGIGDFGLGLEMRNESINSNSLGEWSRMNYGFFGEYSFNKIKKLLINVGAYTNYNSDFGWQVLPGFDIGYTFYKDFRMFVNAGTGQRLPTYTDLYYKGPSNIGNDQLVPEHSVHSEAGFKYNTEKLNASVSYFRRNMSDFIDWVKVDVADPWQPQNFQEIETNGLSLSGDYRLMDHHTSSDFNVLAGLSYTWLQSTIKEKGNSNQISQYALDNLRNQLVARMDVGYQNKFNVSLAAKYQQRFNYAEYILLDTRISAKMKNVEMYADVNNLTNVSYIEAGAVPMVGRWVTAGLKWNWKK
ncbi:MAG: TonB-dependent receptor, partial [Ginsengibacter sp.]